MVTTNLISEEDKEAATTLVLYSKASGKIFKEVTTSLIPEEEDEAESEVALALIQLSQTHPIQRSKRMKADKSPPEEVEIADQAEQPKNKRQRMEEDDSEETLRMMLNWKKITPEKPPLLRQLMGVCSTPMRKQLSVSDVEKHQCRLMLGKAQVKNMTQQVIGKSEKVGTKGLEVSVYGPDGEVRKMMFKMWNGDTPVLTSTGWKKFVKDFNLQKHCDFLTIWMFTHKDTREICFAIHCTRFPTITQPLSKRILKDVFQNPN